MISALFKKCKALFSLDIGLVISKGR